MQDEKQADARHRLGHLNRGRVLHDAERARQVSDKTKAHGHKHQNEEEVGRYGKDRTQLFDPTKVDQHDKHDKPNGDLNTKVVEARSSGRDLGHAGRHRDCHCQDVVGEQRCGGDLSRESAQIVTRDDIGAATARVGVDRLLVGDCHNGEQHDDRNGDWERQRKGRRAGCCEHHQDFLSCIGGGGQGIGGKDGQAYPFGDGLMGGIRRG